MVFACVRPLILRSPSVSRRLMKSWASIEARAISSSGVKCCKSTFVPWRVTKARASNSLLNTPPLKSLQKSAKTFLHSIFVLLIVNLRFTWQARFLVLPLPLVPTTRRSSVFQPLCLVWKWISETWQLVSTGGTARTRRKAKKIASTCCSNIIPAPPVEEGLDTAFCLSEFIAITPLIH